MPTAKPPLLLRCNKRRVDRRATSVKGSSSCSGTYDGRVRFFVPVCEFKIWEGMVANVPASCHRPTADRALRRLQVRGKRGAKWLTMLVRQQLAKGDAVMGRLLTENVFGRVGGKPRRRERWDVRSSWIAYRPSRRHVRPPYQYLYRRVLVRLGSSCNAGKSSVAKKGPGG